MIIMMAAQNNSTPNSLVRSGMAAASLGLM